MTIDRVALAWAAAGATEGRVVDWAPEPMGHEAVMPTTEALERIRGVLDVHGSRRSFSLVTKTIRSMRFLPAFAALPQEVQALIEPMWRTEPEVYASGLHGSLPPGLRAPRLYALEPLDEGRVRLWLEDVVAKTGAWDISTYASAAFVLGRLAGRYPAAAIPWTFTRLPLDLHGYLDTRIALTTIPMLRDERTWQHPLLVHSVDDGLMVDTLRLWGRAHQLLDLLDDLPLTLTHGDACPQNLLIEPESSELRFVAIDWGLTGIGPIGADLVQLVAGRAESGELDPANVPAIEDAILPAYRAGLAAEGVAEDHERVERGYRTQLVVRCGFTALPLERLEGARDDDLDLASFFGRRARWARMVLSRVPDG